MQMDQAWSVIPDSADFLDIRYYMIRVGSSRSPKRDISGYFTSTWFYSDGGAGQCQVRIEQEARI